MLLDSSDSHRPSQKQLPIMLDYRNREVGLPHGLVKRWILGSSDLDRRGASTPPGSSPSCPPDMICGARRYLLQM
jgi:hypothetical protein